MDLKIRIKTAPILKRDKLKKKFDDNVKFGIVMALIHYQNEVERNLTTNKFGIKARHGESGLRGSFSRKILKKPNQWIGRVGTNLVYAAIQEFGGKIQITKKMTGFFWIQFKETGELIWKHLALLGRKGGQIKIPAHFYMKRTLKEEKRKIAFIVERTLLRGIG